MMAQVLPKTTRNHVSGLPKQLNKATFHHSTTLPISIMMALASHLITKKRKNGMKKLQHKVVQRLNITWEKCISKTK